ncbi:aldehyde dehydrogenase family protein [Nocardia neocaledoniensis]|uniref:aldehyde dehydrogenase family protein n=1 Tax=Nocardia neocaledoniensis TaxID=236511 RepID=UPI002458C3CC|nr:aldehyde dehydrogenase family protein [Nocardia neocaledoniensis]
MVATATQKFYIDGAWVDPLSSATLDVIDPATEQSVSTIAMGNEKDVERAVVAARRAFDSFSATTREERIALLTRVIEVYSARTQELAGAVTAEMGSPAALAVYGHVPAGLGHLQAALEALRDFEFERTVDSTLVVHEPIGVCALITPWNWPLNQIAAKVAPALAAGCTMVLKPSEVAPLSALLFAEVMHEAGVPRGVFNLINGDGPTVGTALSSHPEVDLVSFTGSTRAGIEVAKNAAPTVKRVTQELGGKSANIILDDEAFAEAIARDVSLMFLNSGQSCNAGTRMLVPAARMDEAAEIAARTVGQLVIGSPGDAGTTMGPVVSEAQFNRIQALIQAGVDEGATLVTGGPGRPEGTESGYFVRPTVFADVTNDMTVAREEIFGPVLTLLGYRDEEDAVRIANDTIYGLSGYVSSADTERARRIARRLRTGNVHVNGAQVVRSAPFGGYKQSGNGRESGPYGLAEFTEIKAVFGGAG